MLIENHPQHKVRVHCCRVHNNLLIFAQGTLRTRPRVCHERNICCCVHCINSVCAVKLKWFHGLSHFVCARTTLFESTSSVSSHGHGN